MINPDPRYIPKAKSKSKTPKTKRVVVDSNFPTQAKKNEMKPLKKKAPFGNNHVWSN